MYAPEPVETATREEEREGDSGGIFEDDADAGRIPEAIRVPKDRV